MQASAPPAAPRALPGRSPHLAVPAAGHHPPASRTDRARRLARAVHGREGLFAYVERVAAAVPASAERVALVHRICFPGGPGPRQVARLLHLDDDEREALALLVRRRGEGSLAHVRRITAHAAGPARELALVVTRAALEVGRDGSPTRRQARELIDRAWVWPVAA